MMKESINQGGKVIINLYAPNSRHSNKAEKTHVKCQIKNSIIK